MTRARDKAIADSIALDQSQRDFRQATKAAAELAEARDRIALLERDLDVAEQRLDIALHLEDAAKKHKPPPLPAVKKGEQQAAFLLACSDWHAGERVYKATVSGRNEFNIEVLRKRVTELSEGARWLIESWRSGKDGYGWKMNQVVCWLGGDMMTGAIHEDLRETNELSPTQQLLVAQELIMDLIDALAKHPGIDQVVVPTSRGNHGRDTPDRRISSGHLRSYEQMMYWQIQRHYARTNRKVHVIVQDDEITRLDVLGHKLRFAHGDQFKYVDGVGGITIPMIKWLNKLDATEKAECTFVGHHHQFMDIGRAIVNNSLIGWGAYSQRVAPYAPPSQVACLIEAKRGVRMSTEIFVK